MTLKPEKANCFACNAPVDGPSTYRGEPVHGECRRRLTTGQLAVREPGRSR